MPPLRSAKELKKQAKAGLELPLMLHDGEATLGGWVGVRPTGEDPFAIHAK